MTELHTQLQSSLGATYTIGRELGGGGMSRVFVASEHALGREVVVKVLAPELAAGVNAERFAREVATAARLQQANIVPVLTAGIAGDLPWYTMPFVRGESLRARLTNDPKPTVTEAIGILRDVARALAYAHAEGLVHRDIKPENILLSGGTAVVTDFGIAKAIAAGRGDRPERAESARDPITGLTMAGVSLGTPAYMAPEQALGDTGTDHRADLYAWGIVAWELLAGVHPFAKHTTMQALVAAHIAETPQSPASARPDVPPTLAALVMRCLEKDPARRPASANEVLTTLESAATPAERSVPVPARARRLRLGVALVGAIAAIAATAAAVVVARRGEPPASGAPADEPSLAVLPFTSLGGDTANAYFAEGIADELTTALARLPGLRLAGRASTAKLKQRAASAQEIGSALGVRSVLDGTVRRAGGRVRVSAELTRVSDGTLLWKESYERDMKDVFAVQDELAAAIAGALRVRLEGGATSDSVGATERRGTNDLAAYDLYLRGLQLYRRRGAGLRDAERYLEQAIARDPSFARAHATLASVLLVEPYYFDRSMASVLPRARAAAERAVALDAASPYAQLALGHAHLEAFEWAAADAALQRALAIDPRNSEAAFRLGFALLARGRARESIAPFAQAKAIDPFYAMPSVYLAWALSIVGRNEEALTEGRRAHDLEPANEAINTIFANVLLNTGRTEEAIAFARQQVPLQTNIRRLGLYASVLGRAGAREDAAALLRRIEALPAGTWGRAASLSHASLALGDTARALASLETAAAGDGDLVLAQPFSAPSYDRLRASPRFAALLRRFNLDVARLTAPDGGRSR